MWVGLTWRSSWSCAVVTLVAIIIIVLIAIIVAAERISASLRGLVLRPPVAQQKPLLAGHLSTDISWRCDFTHLEHLALVASPAVPATDPGHWSFAIPRRIQDIMRKAQPAVVHELIQGERGAARTRLASIAPASERAWLRRRRSCRS